MKQNGHPITNGEPDNGQPLEAVVARLLFERLQKDNWLVPGDRDAIAYRIAEIMVHAKELYTRVLPRLLGKAEEMQDFQSELAGFRMSMLHMRDLVSEFDGAYLDAMSHEREIDPDNVTEWITPESEWEDSELEEDS